jgi:hypothetical protein
MAADSLAIFSANTAIKFSDGTQGQFLDWARQFESALFLQDPTGDTLAVLDMVSYKEGDIKKLSDTYVYFALNQVVSGRAKQVITPILRTNARPGREAFVALYNEYIKVDADAKIDALTTLLKMECIGTDVNKYQGDFDQVVRQLQLTKVLDPVANDVIIKTLLMRGLVSGKFELFRVLHKELVLSDVRVNFFTVLRAFCKTNGIDMTGKGNAALAVPGRALAATAPTAPISTTCDHCYRKFFSTSRAIPHTASTCPHRQLSATEARRVQQAYIDAQRDQRQARAVLPTPTTRPLSVKQQAQLASSSAIASSAVSIATAQPTALPTQSAAQPIQYTVSYTTTTPPQQHNVFLASMVNKRQGIVIEDRPVADFPLLCGAGGKLVALPSLFGAKISAKIADVVGTDGQLYMDSCASSNFICDESLFDTKIGITPFSITGIGESTVMATHSGILAVDLHDLDGQIVSVTIPAYYSKDTNANLLATTQLCSFNWEYHQTKEDCVVVLPSGQRLRCNLVQGIPSLRVTPTRKVSPATPVGYFTTIQTSDQQLVLDLVDAQYSTNNVSIEQIVQLPISAPLGVAFKVTERYTPSIAEAVSTHLRFGHLNFADMCAIFNWNVPKGIPACFDCNIVKSKRQPTTGQLLNKATYSGQRTFVDTVGPLPPSLSKQIYAVDALDEFSNYLDVYGMQLKSEIDMIMRQHVVDKAAQSGVFIGLGSTSVSDCGREYISTKIGDIYLDLEVGQKATPPYTAEQNSVERQHQTLTNMSNAMLATAHMSSAFWLAARKYAAFIKNRITNKITNQLPYDMFNIKTGVLANHFEIRVFGATAFVHIERSLRSKLQPSAWPGRFVGYDALTGYPLIYNPVSGNIVAAKHVHIADVVLDQSTAGLKINILQCEQSTTAAAEPVISEAHSSEQQPALDQEQSVIRPQQQELNASRSIPSQPLVTLDMPPSQNLIDFTQQQLALGQTDSISSAMAPISRRSARSGGHASSKAHDAATALRSFAYHVSKRPVELSPVEQLDPTDISTISFDEPLVFRPRVSVLPTGSIVIPASEKEALAGSDVHLWTAAMEEERLKLAMTNSLSVVQRDQLADRQIVLGYKWVFTIKRNQCNARLTLQGFGQREGIDYFETRAPTIDSVTLRMFYATAANRHMYMCQVDFKSAFLHGEFSQDIKIFMRMPIVWKSTEGDNNILKLDRPLYGAKQASREFYLKLKTTLTEECALIMSSNDECFFFNDQQTIFLVLHVDDFLLATLENSSRDAILATLEKQYEFSKVAILGAPQSPPTVFLGYEINYDQSAGVLELRLTEYFKELLERADMRDCNPASTPLDPTMLRNLLNTSAALKLDILLEPEQALLYSSSVCSMLWASQFFSDLQYPVNLLARTLHAPTRLCRILLKSVLRYISGRIDLPLRYGGPGGSMELIAFGDASWAAEPRSRSQSGGIILLNNAAIDSYSNVQPVVSLSSFEAELYQTSTLAQRVLFVRNLAIDFGNPQTNPTACCIDNYATIKLANGSVGSSKTKHLRIRLDYLRNLIESHQLKVCYCPGTKLPADMNTKALGRLKLQEFRNMVLGL